ncbi:MAG: hypothetical protein ACOC1O_02875 [bacterium]
MGGSKLFILVEGNDDERFFKRIIIPLFEDKFDSINLWQHAQRSKEDKKKLITSIRELENDYVYVEDIDDTKTIIGKKNQIKTRIDYINYEKIIIVVKEIESWYLAGLSKKKAEELQLPLFESTDDVYKEDFNDLIPPEYLSRIDFMQEILNDFSISKAVKKNKSFAYFMDRYNLPLSL